MPAKGRIYVDEEKCKGCSLCISVCPFDLLALNTEKINKKGYIPVYIHSPEKCTGCANCATMCPDSVIEVERL